jgi:hypothetical protein
MNNCQAEYNNINSELDSVHRQIERLPKGSLRKRIVRGKEYYYLQYRDGSHVKSIYVKASDYESLQIEINSRKELERKARELEHRLSVYAKLIGLHRTYRPIKNIDYEEYTLFMSKIAHDHKNMNQNDFLKKYDVSKYRGLNKRYLAGYLDYINGIDRQNTRKTNDLVLDPFTYIMYFKYGQKDVLNEQIKHAIPAFLSRGLLITSVQEAVNGSFSK